MGIMKIIKNMKINDKLYTQYRFYIAWYNLLQDELLDLVKGYDELKFYTIKKRSFIKLLNQEITPYAMVYGIVYEKPGIKMQKDELFYLPISPEDIEEMGRYQYFKKYTRNIL
jgi:hypothetical protein